MSFKETKIGQFYERRKRWIKGFGGLYLLFGFKFGIGWAGLGVGGAALSRAIPPAEEKVLAHPYSIEVIVDNVKDTKNGARLKTHYYNDKGRKKKKTLILEADGDQLKYKMHEATIDSIINTIQEDDRLRVNGYTARYITDYVTDIKEIN